MSGSSSTPLSDAEKTDIRRYAGYPVYGQGVGDATFNRFTVVYELLEYRMNVLTAAELAVVRSKLSDLATLDAAIPATSTNLDTDQAAVWYHNKNEMRDRVQLFNWRRIDLCAFLGVPPGVGITKSGGGSAMELVV